MDFLYALQPVWLGIGIYLSAGSCSLLQPTCSDSYLLINTLHANGTTKKCCYIAHKEQLFITNTVLFIYLYQSWPLQ